MAVGGWGESQGSISPAPFALRSAMCGFLRASDHGAELLHGTHVGSRGARGEKEGRLEVKVDFQHGLHGRVALSWVGSKVGCIGKGRVPQGAQTVAGWTGEVHLHGGCTGVASIQSQGRKSQ